MKTEFISRSKTNNKLLGHTNFEITHETIKRELAIQICKDLPIEFLEKVFQFEVIDPTKEETLEKLRDYKTPPHEKEMINHLRINDETYFEAKVKIE